MFDMDLDMNIVKILIFTVKRSALCPSVSTDDADASVSFGQIGATTRISNRRRRNGLHAIDVCHSSRVNRNVNSICRLRITSSHIFFNYPLHHPQTSYGYLQFLHSSTCIQDSKQLFCFVVFIRLYTMQLHTDDRRTQLKLFRAEKHSILIRFEYNHCNRWIGWSEDKYE